MQNPQNVNLVVDIAVEYTDAMGGWQKVLDVMEKAPNASQMEFAYLARRIASSEEPEEHYRYIVAAAKCQQFQVRTCMRDTHACMHRAVRPWSTCYASLSVIELGLLGSCSVSRASWAWTCGYGC